ncbi:MAG: NnrS family protein [Candidatus Sulfotelmatobacter sp.]
MSALPTRIEREAGRPLTPLEMFDITAAREATLSRLLMLYISTGLIFMLLPGTFLGVWNLLSISSHRAADSVSPAWIQAHGHAQIFGWIGTFILGIGFYSIPKLRRMNPFGLSVVASTWALWTLGVTLRWLSSVYQWQWRVFLPLSAFLEIAAFLIFFRTVSGHRPQGSGKTKLDEWVFVVIAGSIGLLLTLLINAGACLFLALRGNSPELPASFDQRFLVLQTWGFLVPFVWGFSAKWLPVFLGLRPIRGKALLSAVALNSLGVAAALASRMAGATVLLLAGIIASGYALRLFEKTERPAKTKGVHPSLPLFVRLAYVWALVAASLAFWAAFTANAHGIWGASRHALTVGFLSTMVFAIGQRVLPAFSGMRLLFSTKLMLAALLLLTVGCAVRVSSEVLAYQGFVKSAWSWLPVSAITEMTAVTLFALNLFITFARRPPSAQV